jgi:hypothetical protein
MLGANFSARMAICPEEQPRAEADDVREESEERLL